MTDSRSQRISCHAVDTGHPIEITLTRQFVAEVALLGMALDMLGGCYLAYDLLGGKGGPLRTLARAAGYVALFSIGYAVVLGLRYAMVAALGMGILLALEYRGVGARAEPATGSQGDSRRRSLPFGFLRGVVLGLAAMTTFGAKFGLVFGLLAGAGLSATYALGFAPTDDYETQDKPSFSIHKIVASLLRALAVTIAGIVAGLIAKSMASTWAFFGLRLGLAAGAVSALVGVFSPVVEWRIDRLPERTLGVLGLFLIFAGILLQSVQYWVVVFDVSIR